MAQKTALIQRKPDNEHVFRVVAGGRLQREPRDLADTVNAGLSSGGRPLDAETKAFMEPRFDHDFSSVRVHTDENASRSAQAVEAKAFTVGSDIAFRDGAYNPGTSEGKRLLAHELTHVVQQGAAAPMNMQVKLEVSQPDDPAEVEADEVARQVIAQDDVNELKTADHRKALQRQEAPEEEEEKKPEEEKPEEEEAVE